MVGKPLEIIDADYLQGLGLSLFYGAPSREMTVQPRSSASNIILTNIETVPGKTVTQHMGLVQGSSVRAKHIGRDIAAGLKNIVGGELKGYTELLQEAREEATSRMVQEAQKRGANAIVNVRFATSSLTQGAAELFAYGTAVRVE